MADTPEGVPRFTSSSSTRRSVVPGPGCRSGPGRGAGGRGSASGWAATRARPVRSARRASRERRLAYVDHVVSRDLVGRDVDLLPVDQEVPVDDELAGVATRAREPTAVDHVVEAALEQLQQVVTGLARTTRGLGVVVVELLLHHAVREAGLLL